MVDLGKMKFRHFDRGHGTSEFHHIFVKYTPVLLSGRMRGISICAGATKRRLYVLLVEVYERRNPERCCFEFDYIFEARTLETNSCFQFRCQRRLRNLSPNEGILPVTSFSKDGAF